jgi:beta-lactamase class A
VSTAETSLMTALTHAPARVALWARRLPDGPVVSYRADEVFPSASLIKLAVLVEVFRRFEEEGYPLDRRLRMTAEDQVGGSGVLQDLATPSYWSVRDLVTLMITVSDNTATNLLIDHLGVDRINATASALGLSQTRLVRRLERLPVPRGPEYNQTTAADMGRLLYAMARGQVVSLAASRRMLALLERCQGPLCIAAPPRPRWAGSALPPALRVAHKTASLADARHDAGVVAGPHGAYVAAVLMQGAPEARLRRFGERLGRLLFRWGETGGEANAPPAD